MEESDEPFEYEPLSEFLPTRDWAALETGYFHSYADRRCSVNRNIARNFHPPNGAGNISLAYGNHDSGRRPRLGLLRHNMSNMPNTIILEGVERTTSRKLAAMVS